MARIHVAGNTVLDVVVPGVPLASPGADSWGANVQLLREPVTAVLGGGGAAPAYLLARLGHAVSLSTNLGTDTFGSLLTGWLRDAGVGLEPLPAVGTASATHVMHISGRERQSSYYRGGPVDWAAGLPAEPPDWFIASGHGAVSAADLNQLTTVCAGLRRTGVRVLFDPSPWFAGRVDRAEMLRMWSVVDVLSATQEELACWLPDVDDAAGGLATAGVSAGPSLVVVKRGPEGATWATAQDQGEVTTRVVQGNSVGAGDSFNARLVDGLARGESPGEAVTAAVETATNVVDAGRGVLGLYPPYQENGEEK
ncbi:MAG: carbohydrate kinase family protein [Candidatus Latescibacterota bacterium]|nr:carbohydrate kinase family protein [Candidatus Latescibacterota bacterium]